MARAREFEEGAVLRAARDQFWKTGYEATSLKDLILTTGLGSQSIYNAFGTKHDLFVRILQDYTSVQLAAVKSALTQGTHPWHSMLAVVQFEDGIRTPMPPEGCLMSTSAATLSARDDDVRGCAVRMYDGVKSAFCEQIQRAIDAGEIGDDLDVETTALALMTVMQGIEYMRKCGIDDEEFVRARDAAVDLVVRATETP